MPRQKTTSRGATGFAGRLKKLNKNWKKGREEGKKAQEFAEVPDGGYIARLTGM